MKVKKTTIIRTIVLIIALFNLCLTTFGRSPLPIDDETIQNVISFAFTMIASLVAWWKNNSFTFHAIKSDEVLEMLRNNFDVDEVIKVLEKAKSNE